MSTDEKDRLGDKLRDLEHAREEKFFAERDKALLAKLREKDKGASAACPACGAKLRDLSDQIPGVSVCDAGHGAWFSPGAVRVLAGETDLPALRLLEKRLPTG